MWAMAGSFAAGIFGVYFLREDELPVSGTESPVEPAGGAPEEHVVVNWSGTHECHPKMLHQPETIAELEAIVADYHKRGGLLITKTGFRYPSKS